jgi:hypothetical protein
LPTDSLPSLETVSWGDSEDNLWLEYRKFPPRYRFGLADRFTRNCRAAIEKALENAVQEMIDEGSLSVDIGRIGGSVVGEGVGEGSKVDPFVVE